MAEIKVGDLVWLPTPIRDNPAKTALDEQMLGFEESLTTEPGRVVSIDASGWVMVDRGSFGQFGHHISTLRLAQGRPDLTLGPAIEAAAQAMRDANTPDIWTDPHLVPMGAFAKAAIVAALPELRKAIAEELAQLIDVRVQEYRDLIMPDRYTNVLIEAAAIVRGQSGGGQ